MSDVAERIEVALQGVTQGDWYWGGSIKFGIRLMSKASGRPYVMDFRRHGMQGAQPIFPVQTDAELLDAPPTWHNGVMTDATHLAIRGVPYRDDVVDIDNPNARLIAAAPSLLRDALDEIRSLQGRLAELEVSA